MTIETEIEAHIAAIEEAYREIITGSNTRIEGGSRLCFVRDPDEYRIELIERATG